MHIILDLFLDPVSMRQAVWIQPKEHLSLFLCDRQDEAMRIASELVALNDDRKGNDCKGVGNRS